MVKAYKYIVKKGTRKTGTRKGMIILAIPRISEGNTGDLIFYTSYDKQDGDIATHWGLKKGGWSNYGYTHGGKVYRTRCRLAEDLYEAGYPSVFKFKWDGVEIEKIETKEIVYPNF